MAKQQTTQFPGAFSLLRPSAQAMILNIWTFLALFTIALVYSIISNFSENQTGSPVMMLLSLGSLVLNIMVAPAYVITQLQSAKEKEISFGDAVREGLPYVFRIFFLQLLTLVLVVIGLVLVIVPGLFAVQRLLLAPFYLVDKDLGIIEAMKASATDSKKYSGAVWGLIGASVAFALPVFTIILTPVSIVLLLAYICAPAIRYYQIQIVREKKKTHTPAKQNPTF